MDEDISRLNDVPKLLITLRKNWHGSEAELDRKLHQYYLACCRAIWRLLPQKASRNGIEVAERYVNGLATDDELRRADWHAEGAAFNIDYNCYPDKIERWADEVRAIPLEELHTMIHPLESDSNISAQELLKRAAYFADFAIIYPHLSRKEPRPKHVLFLSAPLLQEIFGSILYSE